MSGSRKDAKDAKDWHVGSHVKWYRIVQGMSKGKLVKKANISMNTLLEIEASAVAKVPLETLFRITEALEITLADILGTERVVPVHNPSVPQCLGGESGKGAA